MSNEYIKFTAGEDLRAGDPVLIDKDGVAVKAEVESADTLIMRQKVRAGKQFAFPASELPAAKQAEEAEQPVVEPQEQTHKEPILFGADPKLVKQGYVYQGSDGKGNYYYANASGAYTLRTNGQLARVGNRFDVNFLKTLKS